MFMQRCLHCVVQKSMVLERLGSDISRTEGPNICER